MGKNPREIKISEYSDKQYRQLTAEYGKLQSGFTIAEQLDMLAEEASELTQAALKLKRALGTGYRTPTDAAEAWDSLHEEVGDVLTMINNVYKYQTGNFMDIAKYFYHAKLVKWQRFVERMGGALPAGIEPVFYPDVCSEQKDTEVPESDGPVPIWAIIDAMFKPN